MADLLDAALADALVLRAHLGWRPFPRDGFQVELGYGWIGLGAGIPGSALIAIETGNDLSAFLDDPSAPPSAAR